MTRYAMRARDIAGGIADRVEQLDREIEKAGNVLYDAYNFLLLKTPGAPDDQRKLLRGLPIVAEIVLDDEYLMGRMLLLNTIERLLGLPEDTSSPVYNSYHSSLPRVAGKPLTEEAEEPYGKQTPPADEVEG